MRRPAAGKRRSCRSLSIQYADYAQWQRGWLTGDVLERQMSYWRTALAGAPRLLELPYDHARPAVKSYRGARVAQRIDADLVARLQALGQRAWRDAVHDAAGGVPGAAATG